MAWDFPTFAEWPMIKLKKSHQTFHLFHFSLLRAQPELINPARIPRLSPRGRRRGGKPRTYAAPKAPRRGEIHFRGAEGAAAGKSGLRGAEGAALVKY